MLDKEDSTRYHLIVLAKNNEGLQSLYKLSSKSFIDGFYYKPRIDIDTLKPYAENLIVLSACMAGKISRLLMNDEFEKANEYAVKYKSIFPNYYIEIQSHNTQEQLKLNQQLLKIAKDNNIPWVITLDTHMVNQDDMEAHSIFVQIGDGREVGESYTGCYLQSTEEIISTMSKCISKEDILIGIENTNKIADMCNVTIEAIDNKNYPNQMPHINIPKGYKSIDDYYKKLILKGWDKRGINKFPKEKKQIYKERVLHEYDVLKYLDYIDYFVMLYQLTNKAKERKIPVGYSRGSGGNCLSLYLLGVTEIDSIKWNLDFSRFGSKGRKSAPDYDMDISKQRRKEMIEVAKELFGEEFVAPICTFNSFSTKVAIRDIGKILDERGVYEIPYSLRDDVAKMIPVIKSEDDDETDKEILLQDAIKDNKRLQDIYKKYPLWFKHVMKLEGLPKSLGQHAAGVLITRKPIITYGALCFNSDKEPIFQLEMHNAMDDL
jgi:DNA polymerase-3 subunit alpha